MYTPLRYFTHWVPPSSQVFHLQHTDMSIVLLPEKRNNLSSDCTSEVLTGFWKESPRWMPVVMQCCIDFACTCNTCAFLCRRIHSHLWSRPDLRCWWFVDQVTMEAMAWSVPDILSSLWVSYIHTYILYSGGIMWLNTFPKVWELHKCVSVVCYISAENILWLMLFSHQTALFTSYFVYLTVLFLTKHKII